MFRLFRRRRKNGQAIVEMAFLFPFFLLVIAGGIIDFGFAFYNFIKLQQIANDAAQFAAEGYKLLPGVPDDAPPPGKTVIDGFVRSKKPRWWAGELRVEDMALVKSSDGLATIVKLLVSYKSQVYTPLYQVLMGQVTGHNEIPLRVMTAYQVRNN